MSDYKIDYCHHDSVTTESRQICITEKATNKETWYALLDAYALYHAEVVMEDDIMKIKWRHGDKHYLVPFGGLLELWEKYEEQEHVTKTKMVPCSEIIALAQKQEKLGYIQTGCTLRKLAEKYENGGEKNEADG